MAESTKVNGRGQKPRVLELFAGAGGLALGLERAGFRAVALVENNKDAADTLRANRPKWNVRHESVERVDWKEYEGVDVVSGGFPCQAFSYAGKGLGFDDPRGGLVFEMFRCIRETRPKVVLAENVPGLASHRKGQTLSEILRGLKKCGYGCSFARVVNAADYGVPQKRRRLLIVGVNDSAEKLLLPNFPPPLGRKVTIGEALEGCPPSPCMQYSDKKRRVLEMVPPGGCWVDLPDKIQREYMGTSYGHNGAMGGRRGMARRMSWDEPSLTILCSPAQKQTERCHPEETRPFSVRESARLQTFPDEWRFEGGLASQYAQIGNAVPVKFGEVVGNYVKSLLKEM